jgi:hypothetical protein
MSQRPEGDRPAPLPVAQLRQALIGDPAFFPQSLKTARNIGVHLWLKFLTFLIESNE